MYSQQISFLFGAGSVTRDRPSVFLTFAADLAVTATFTLDDRERKFLRLDRGGDRFAIWAVQRVHRDPISARHAYSFAAARRLQFLAPLHHRLDFASFE